LDGGGEVAFLESPAIVAIEASAPELNIYNSQVYLGKWKAQLKSAHGGFWQVFDLRSADPIGSNGEWLEGDASGPKGEREEIDFGYIEGNLLGFTIKLNHPEGQHGKTFFIGKMTKDKIVGTFVDDAGIRGEWTAVGIAASPNP
jgi:hypothetical protein